MVIGMFSDISTAKKHLQKRVSLGAVAAHIKFQSIFCVTRNTRHNGDVKSRETVYLSTVAEYKTDVFIITSSDNYFID